MSEIRSAQVTDWPRIDQIYADSDGPPLQGRAPPTPSGSGRW